MLKKIILTILLINVLSSIFAFDIPKNSRIDKWIGEYTNSRRHHYQLSINRSGLYRPIIIRVFKNAGIPEELSWLPFIESGFRCGAESTAKAAGCWQFIPRTGKYFGLGKDNWTDQRFDFNRSTIAASKYLKELYETFHDWELVLAAYNCGPGKVNYQIKKKGKDFWKLDLPDQTEEYVPKFYAVLSISRDLKKYGFISPKNELISVELRKGSHNLRYIATKILGVEYDDFIMINPGFDINHTPPGISSTIYIMKDWNISLLRGFGLLKKSALAIN